MRVRNIVTRSGKRFRGKFPSQKLARMVHWESILERDAILHLEYHPLILSYQEQPSIEIYYDIEANAHRYVPDFRAILAHGPQLYIEVKPRRHLYKPAMRCKLQSVALRFEERGCQFRIWTEEVIRREPLFNNLRALHRAARPLSQQEACDRLDILRSAGTVWSFSEVVNQLGSLRVAASLVRAGFLQADLEREALAEATVWVPGNEGGNHGSFRI